MIQLGLTQLSYLHQLSDGAVMCYIVLSMEKLPSWGLYKMFDKFESIHIHSYSVILKDYENVGSVVKRKHTFKKQLELLQSILFFKNSKI